MNGRYSIEICRLPKENVIMLLTKKKNMLETNSIGKLMLQLCTQTTFSIMLYNIYTITDTFFVANGVGSTASGAIGIFTPVLVLINGISSTLSTGGGSIISRKLGENDRTSGKTVVGCMIWLWGICALVITAVGILFLNPLLQLLGCTDDIYPYAVQYGRIMLISTIISTGFSGIMRAEGNMFYSTLQWCCPVIINIILDPLFIYVFHMGITGAALATLIAQMFSFGCSIYYFFFRKVTPSRVGVRDIRWNFEVGREMISIGMPSFFYSLGNSFAGTVGNQMLRLVGGTQAISTFAVVSRIQLFTSTPFGGIMQGIQPMLGFDWGRKNVQRVKMIMFYALRFSIIYGCLIAVILYLGAYQIIRIFTLDIEIIHMAKGTMQILCWSLLVGGIMPIIQAYFQALGYGKKVLLLSLESILFLRLPLYIIGAMIKNLNAIWYVFVLSDWLIAGLAMYNYRKHRKGEVR